MVGKQIIVAESRRIAVEESQEHDWHQIHHGFHSWHLVAGSHHIVVHLCIKNRRNSHEQAKKTHMIPIKRNGESKV